MTVPNCETKHDSIMAVQAGNQIQVAPPVAWFGTRHAQTVLLAVSSFTIYMLRVNLSVAIVGMTGMDDRRPPDTGNNATTGNATTTTISSPGAPAAALHEVYDWDEATQGLVLSSFFWGYLITQVPAGVLTQRFGGHRFLTWALFSTSVLCVLLPPCAYVGGWQLVCLNRMLQGVTQGCVYPSIFTMMGLWMPPAERSTLSGIILGAQTMGPVVATPLAGLLVAKCGWPSVFYSYGALGVAYSLVVMRYCAESPSAHKSISDEERAYIVASLGGPSRKARTPWRLMMRSIPTWAAIWTMALQGGVFLAFLTKIPTYLSTVLKFEMKENGVLTALPYLLSWFLSFPFGASCDWFVKRGHLSLTVARKMYNSISHVGSGLAILALGFCTDTALSVVLLCMSIGVMSASYPGVQANFMDLSPNFSGTIFSISNFLSACCGVVAPLLISCIVTEKGSVSQWRTVYCLLSAVMLISNLGYIVFGSAETQPWNNPSRKGEEEEADDEEEMNRDKKRMGEFTAVGEKLSSIT